MLGVQAWLQSQVSDRGDIAGRLLTLERTAASSPPDTQALLSLPPSVANQAIAIGSWLELLGDTRLASVQAASPPRLRLFVSTCSSVRPDFG